MAFVVRGKFLKALLCTAVSVLASAQPVRMYFGNGCFFARQHLFIQDFEQKVLGRANDKLTAIAGYAGSYEAGVNNTACYHNPQNFSDYGYLGDGEVVELDVPAESLESAFTVYFGSFIEVGQGVWGRPDPYDQGAEYRSLIGIPGGFSNEQAILAMKRANVNNMTLTEGKGSDPDTFTAGTILIMDSDKFRFIQAEECLQFHDDSQAIYSEAYHNLKPGLEARGRLVPTACPGNFICNSSMQTARSDMIV